MILDPIDVANLTYDYLVQLQEEIAGGVFADGDPRDCLICLRGYIEGAERKEHLFKHLALREVRLATLWWAAAAYADSGTHVAATHPTSPIKVHVALMPMDVILKRMREFFLLRLFDNPFVDERAINTHPSMYS